MKNAYATYTVRETVCRKHVLPYIGGVKLQRLQTYHITDLLLRLQRNGVGASARRLVHTTLGAALNLAVQRKVLQTNPISDVPRPRAPRKPIKPWTVEEAKTFLNAATTSPCYALFVLALTAGMRQGELFALQWDDVDLNAGRLHVCRSLAEGKNGVRIFKEPKTASSVRQIELSSLAIAALTDLSKLPRRGNLVFTSEKGQPIRTSNFLRREFAPLIEKAGIRRITFHALRHTANTLLLIEGVSPNVVAQRMGHATTRMTLDTYGHVLTGAQRAAADKLMRSLVVVRW